MRYLSLFGLLGVVIGFCIWQQMKDPPQHAISNRQLASQWPKWEDSLFTQLPSHMDTTIVVYDANGMPMSFRSYVKAVFEHKALIYLDRGVWKLIRFTKGAKDSLDNDNIAIPRSAWYNSINTPDTFENAKDKLTAIANTLAQADKVEVFKGKRLMFLIRKGKILKTLHIDLGFTPIGKKMFNKDGKTPEGVYYLDMKYDREDKYYKSIWISYPSPEERAIAKSRGIDPGSGILIHGTPKERKHATDWTAGCIALQNEDIDTLFKYIPEGALIKIRK